MTALDIARLVPGVRPDPDETLVFWVESDSQPDHEHRVDMTCYNGNGRCPCSDFSIRKNGDLERGALPSIRLECKHLRRARRYLSFLIIHGVIEQKKEAGNANKLRAKNKASQLDNGSKANPEGSEVGRPTERKQDRPHQVPQGQLDNRIPGASPARPQAGQNGVKAHAGICATIQDADPDAVPW